MTTIVGMGDTSEKLGFQNGIYEIGHLKEYIKIILGNELEKQLYKTQFKGLYQKEEYEEIEDLFLNHPKIKNYLSKKELRKMLDFYESKAIQKSAQLNIALSMGK